MTKPYQSELLTQEQDRRSANDRYREELQLQIKLKEQQKMNDPLQDPKPNPYQSDALTQEEDRRSANARYREELQAQIKLKEEQ